MQLGLHLSLSSRLDSCARGTFIGGGSRHARWGGKSRLPHFLRVWMPPTFVNLFGTIWLPNHEELCNAKLTCKRDWPSVTIKSRTKQLFVECYLGSRQDILQLLQTWETKSFIKRSLAATVKLYASKEVKEFPKMLQRSNSVRDKNHRKSMLECTGNTSTSWPLNRQLR